MSQPQLERLLAASGPFIDVRSPGEFARGTVPGAVNLPLLDDDERAQVGIAYKHQGRDAALAVGESLVLGSVKQERIARWTQMAEQRPTWLYCWRGGLRSAIAARWLAERDIEVQTVPGGFKALRHACLVVLERAMSEKNWLVLGGRTGSGKTGIIRRRADSIDLEGLANHRGSAFGGLERPQPAPVTFENSLAVAYLRLTGSRLLLEDESRTIGRLALPRPWYQQMQQSPVIVLEATMTERITNIRREYVDDPLTTGTLPEDLLTRYQGALERIRKRLGGARHREAANALVHGFEKGTHERWIELLLTWYYDPMYDYQLSKKQRRVVYRGTAGDIDHFLSGC